MTQIYKHFLIVDDDPLNNRLMQMILKKLFDSVYVNDFAVAEDGLEFMKREPSHNPPDGKTTLFLDINMPGMSGWEYLDEFELLDDDIKMQYDIYMVSSSVDYNDIKRAKENPWVIDFIEKPLSNAKLQKIFPLLNDLNNSE